jgi:hypothetical protein
MSVLGLGSRAPIGLQLATAALLFAATVAPWREGSVPSERTRVAEHRACGQLQPRSDVLLPLEMAIPVVPAPAALSGWGHPDLAPWPHGMVMGMRPDAHDFVVRSQPGIVDSLLSALVRALQVFSA